MSLVLYFSTMHDGRFLHVPVVTTDADTEVETVVGILDVLDCAVHTLSRFTHSDKSHLISTEDKEHDYIYNTKVNSEADRAMFTSLFLRDDVSETEQSILERKTSVNHMKNVGAGQSQVNINDSVSQAGGTRLGKPQTMKQSILKLKIKSNDGNIYRSEIDLETIGLSKLQKNIKKVIGNSKDVTLFYLDEDGDEVLLNSDDSLETALNLTISSKTDKLTVVVKYFDKQSKGFDMDKHLPLLVGGSAVVVLITCVVLLFGKSSSHSQSQRTYQDFRGYNRY